MFELIKEFIKDSLRSLHRTSPDYLSPEPLEDHVGDVIIKVLDAIDTERFRAFNCAANADKRIACHYSNIDLLNKKLTEINAYISNNKIVFNHWCNETSQERMAGDFFTTVDKLYLDEIEAVDLFIVQAKQYCTKYKEISTAKDFNGVNFHNAMVLTNFTNGLVLTANSLLSLSYN